MSTAELALLLNIGRIEYQNQLSQAFNQASQDDWSPTFKGQRAISQQTKIAYLAQFSNRLDQLFAQLVLDNTIYVNWTSLIDNLRQSFNQFKLELKNRPFVIYLPPDKLGSEVLLLVKLWPQIKLLNFRQFVTAGSQVEQQTNVLIVDDAIYSGNNVTKLIDSLLFYNKNKYINFHLVIPYISQSGVQLLSTISGLNQYFSIKSYQLFDLDSLYNSVIQINYTELENTFSRFGFKTKQQIPIYFDHKVANYISTFSPIYCRGVVPERTNFGLLLPYSPDTDIKQRVYNKHFIGLLPPPQKNVILFDEINWVIGHSTVSCPRGLDCLAESIDWPALGLTTEGLVNIILPLTLEANLHSDISYWPDEVKTLKLLVEQINLFYNSILTADEIMALRMVLRPTELIVNSTTTRLKYLGPNRVFKGLTTIPQRGSGYYLLLLGS